MTKQAHCPPEVLEALARSAEADALALESLERAHAAERSAIREAFERAAAADGEARPHPNAEPQSEEPGP